MLSVEDGALIAEVPEPAAIGIELKKQKNHPDKSAVVFKLLPDCPLRWAQYLSPLQSVLHGDRAACYCFWSTPT